MSTPKPVDPETVPVSSFLKSLRPAHARGLIASHALVAVIAGWGGAVLQKNSEVERVEKVEADVARVKDFMQARLVANSETAAMTNELRKAKDPPMVAVCCPIGDASTCELARQIVDIFHTAGWNADLSNAGMRGRGITIVAGSTMAHHAGVAESAFGAAGLSAHLEIIEHFEGIELYIGSREPRGTLSDARLLP